MRIVHVIDPVSPGGGGCTLRLVADVVAAHRQIDHQVIVIGHAGHAELARACGLPVRGSVPAPAGLPMLAGRALRAVLKHLDAEAPIDRVQTWTLSSLLLVCGVFDPARVCGYLPLGPTTDVSLLRLPARRRGRPASVIAASSWIAAECAPVLGMNAAEIPIEAPGVDPSAVFDDGSRRAAIRHALGVTDETFLVGLLSEPGSWADAWPAANATLRLRVMGRNARLLIGPQVRRRPATEVWLRELGESGAMIVDDVVMMPWTMLSALDAVLLPAGEVAPEPRVQVPTLGRWFMGTRGAVRPCPGIMPLLWACAAAVPIVADDVPGVRAVLEEGVTGLLVRSGHYVQAADRLRKLIDDRSLRGRLGAAARTTAHRRFSLARFTSACATHWSEETSGRVPAARPETALIG